MRYERPVRELLLECCRTLPEPFRIADVLGWFGARYPDVASNTLRTQFSTLQRAGQLPVVRDGHGSYRRAPARAPVPAGAAEHTTPTRTRSASDVVLLGCVKTKAPTARPARSLYLSPLWQRRRSYAESTGLPWFVLSAKWGLLDPDEIVAPYDVALKDMGKDYRTAWGEFATQQLAGRYSLSDLVVEVHAGDAYVDAVRGPLKSRGATVVDPVDATSMGATLAWYGTPHAPVAPPATRADPATIDRYVAAALDALGRGGRVHSVAQLLAASQAALNAPGLYSWWVDAAGADDLARGLGLPFAPGLIYVGQAGATRSGGRASDNTLRGRLVSMHLNGTRRFSTLRHSLSAVLDSAFGIDGGEDELSAWMHERLGIAVWPAEDRTSLGAVEDRVVTTLDPPFNLRGAAGSPVRRRLSELRSLFPR